MAGENPDEDDSEFEWNNTEEEKGTEENPWSAEDIRDFYQNVREEFAGFGTFGNVGMDRSDYEIEMSEEDEIAIELYKAGSAMRRFVQYLDTHDEFDPSDDELKTGMDHLSGDQRALMHAFASFGQDLQELSDRLEDDDDENPFRVN